MGQRCMALAQLLIEQNFPAIAIHRGMNQEERLSRYQQFKDFQKRILVATNLFGRGMDIERVNIVFNYDMPEDTDTYLHRVARAGRFSAPGRAISLGGGCGIYGGNPYGCSVGNDTRPPGTPCGGGTWAFGSRALDIDFPQAVTTEWVVGSIQDVYWGTKGGHWCGYTYRLCKIPPEGKKGITEDCFAQNVLKFFTPYTMMRHMLYTDEDWIKVDQDDLTVGTYPAGSAWRHVAKYTKTVNGYLRKDSVVVPESLPEGEYVLSLRWDTAEPQVWSSCANIRLVVPQIIG